jgi:hypothetical protein
MDEEYPDEEEYVMTDEEFLAWLEEFEKRIKK